MSNATEERIKILAEALEGLTGDLLLSCYLRAKLCFALGPPYSDLYIQQVTAQPPRQNGEIRCVRCFNNKHEDACIKDFLNDLCQM